tara:strand:- start:44 stop:274 length:231 start_codon:yes stop_codon:yes gene_type:complete
VGYKHGARSDNVTGYTQTVNIKLNGEPNTAQRLPALELSLRLDVTQAALGTLARLKFRQYAVAPYIASALVVAGFA